MKKILSIILILVVIMSLSSCGGEKTSDDAATCQTVVFYKDGMRTEVKDNELYLQIVNVIESWYQDDGESIESNLLATTDLINEMKRQDTAIELPCVDQVKLSGRVVSEVAIFIPLTGEYKNFVFNNSVQYPNDWSGPTFGGKGLEQFFDGVEFTPLTEEEKRWQSTVKTPGTIEFYENGELIGESRDYKGFELNNKIAKHIESWFYQKEEIETITVSDTPIESAWENETYLIIGFNGSSPTFYGEQIIDIRYYDVIIPLTGEYAYYIFSGEYQNISNVAININGSGLEQFLTEFKNSQE